MNICNAICCQQIASQTGWVNLPWRGGRSPWGVPGLPNILGFIHSCFSPLGQMFPLPLPWSGPFTSNICLLMEPATQLDRRGCPKSLLEICVHCPAQAWVSLSIGKLPTHPLGLVVHMVCLCSGTCQAPPPAKGTVSCLGGRGRGHFPRKPTHGVRRVGGATLIERCSADGRSLGLEPFRVPAKERINSEAGSLSGVLNPPAGG